MAALFFGVPGSGPPAGGGNTDSPAMATAEYDVSLVWS